MGTALAHQIAGNGHKVRAWSIEEDVLADIRDNNRNTKYLNGVRLDEKIEAIPELPRAVEGAELVIISVPSHIVDRVSRDLAGKVKQGQLVLNVAKGMYDGKLLTEVIRGRLGDEMAPAIGGMGGPAIAVEMAKGVPTAVIIGLPTAEGSRRIQSIVQNESLKVEATMDVVGLELCATMKNVFAIALGVCDGLGYGTNTKAFLTNIALEEMAGICEAFGGRRETAYGLAGLGDLLTTGFSPHSRNRTLGETMGRGEDWQQFAETHTVEGIAACKAVRDLTYSQGLETHLLDVVYEMLFLERAPDESIRHFFLEFAY
jgi:glycerol-3-phosphate dehydrogenase (NAD(P)+)